MKYVGPTEILSDGTPIPPVRRISLFVPDTNGHPILCTAVVRDGRQKFAHIEIGPSEGPYRVGDIIEYAWLPGSEFPVVKAGRGRL